MTIGNRIKSLRKELHMTQTMLAEQINSTKQTIYKYEHNIITSIPIDKIQLLAKALKTTPASLLGWDDLSDKIDSVCMDVDSLEKRVDFYVQFYQILELLGYQLTTDWSSDSDGTQIDLLETPSSQIEIPHFAYKEILNSILAFTECQLQGLIKQYGKIPADFTPMPIQEKHSKY